MKDNQELKPLGIQLIGELYNCDKEMLNDVQEMEKCMRKAAEVSNATIVNSIFHHFSPHGVSGVVVIKESHLAVHTWPEHAYASVDFFTCGEETSPLEAFKYLKKALKAEKMEWQEYVRGDAIKIKASLETHKKLPLEDK